MIYYMIIYLKIKIQYIEEFEGAFYGPKLDILIKDSLGREWQTGTIQIDLCSLKNFGFVLDSQKHSYEEHCIIHRAVLGTFERFLGVTLESNQRIPKIINPYLISILPINEDCLELCEKIIDKLNLFKDRIDLFNHKDNLKTNIKSSYGYNYEYRIIIGNKELESNSITIVNQRSGYEIKTSLEYLDYSLFIKD